uniref:Uncharacterized protein n=1 Tax=Lepeophtheirus salmonis TaxID=72036 RepID=A0A0K2U347_LEPSM
MTKVLRLNVKSRFTFLSRGRVNTNSIAPV